MRPVCGDFETHLISTDKIIPPPVCLGISDGTSSRFHREDMEQAFEALLRDDSILYVNSNCAFDMWVAARRWPRLMPLIIAAYEAGRVHDLKHIAAFVDMHKTGVIGPASLAALAKRLFDIDMDKTTWRLGYEQLEGIPTDDWEQGAIDYVTFDAEIAVRVYEALHKEAVNLGVDLSDLGAQARKAFWCQYISTRGIRVDLEYVDKHQSKLRTELAEKTKILQEAGLVSELTKGRGKNKRGTGEYKRNIKVAQGIVDAAIEEHNIDWPRTDGGAVKMSSEVEELANYYVPIVYELLQWAGLQKRIGDLEKFKHLDGDIYHARYDSLKVTGRTSSGGAFIKDGPRINMQNFAREGGMRECLVARPGHVIASLDYASNELRTLAQVHYYLFGSSTLGDLIKRGVCPHLDFAADLMSIDYETAAARRAAGDKEIKQMRTLAKSALFGYPGGLGDEKWVQFAKTAFQLTVPLSKYNVQGEGYKLSPQVLESINTFRFDALDADLQRALTQEYSHSEDNRPNVFEIGGVMRVSKHMLLGAFGDIYVDKDTAGYYRARYFEKFVEMPRYFAYVDSLKREQNRKDGQILMRHFHSNRYRVCHRNAALNTLFQGLAADGAGVAIWNLTKACLQGELDCKILAFIHDEVLLEVPINKATEVCMKAAAILQEGMQVVTPDMPALVEPAIMHRFTKSAEYREINGQLITHEEWMMNELRQKATKDNLDSTAQSIAKILQSIERIQNPIC